MTTMKTVNIFTTSIIAIGLLVAVASCSKDDNMEGTGSPFPSSGQSGAKILGQILDYGTLSASAKGETRLMMATFDNVGEITDAAPSEVIGSGTKVNLTFFVNQDEMIPTGEYAFSSDDKGSFLLGRSFVTYVLDDNQNTRFDKDVTGGSVKVVYDGQNYTFTFDLFLNDGNSLVGTVTGEMEYYDVYI